MIKKLVKVGNSQALILDRTMLEMMGLKEGDEVLTNGGIAGRVTDVQDSFVRLKVAENVELQVQKHSVAGLLPKGTLQD